MTSELAVRGMGWRLAPNRYIKPGRSWCARSQFRPLVDLRDAFRLLDSVTDNYSLNATPNGEFAAEVRLGGRVGRAVGEIRARTISMAVAQALGIEVEANS